MHTHVWVGLVSLAAVFQFTLLGINVGRVRHKIGIMAPTMTGDPRLERAIRVHYNTLEWLPAFLVSMWLFAIYWNDVVAAGLGVVWILGRILYATGYMADPAKRGPGFAIQALTTLVLLFGAAGRLIYLLANGITP
jgi:glutathione S-transferase